MVANSTSCRAAQRMVDLKFARRELDSLSSLSSALSREYELQRLEVATGIADQLLLERLYDRGFSADDVSAFVWFPIAMVAWASGGVSVEELEAAEYVELFASFSGSESATRLFQQWLRERPSDDMWGLWERFTRARAATQSERTYRLIGHATLDVAARVARASGGFAGIGQVCAAEREVLDRIRRVYEL